MDIGLEGKILIIKSWNFNNEFELLLFELQGKICLAEGKMANRIIRLPRGCKVILEGKKIEDEFLINIGCGKNIKPEVEAASIRVK